MLKVFLSHTSELSDFVEAAEGAVQRAKCRPIDMRYFAARDQAPAEYCAEQVAEADVYVGIIGFCYGTPVRDKPEVSYTEHEFDTATRLGKTRLMFLRDMPPVEATPKDYVSDREHDDHQGRFRKKITDAGLITVTVATPDQLGFELLHALHELQRPRRSSSVEDRYGDVFDGLDDVRFTERPWLTDRIHAFLANHPRGYFFIEGKTGVGKTTLMAHLSREHDYPHHFTSGEVSRRSVEGALRSLGTQLVARYELDHLREHLGAPMGFRWLLSEAAKVAKDQGHRLVLVVDGLHQADETEPMPLGLPPELPDNAYVIGTLGEGFPLHGRRLPYDHIRIDPHAEETLDDIRQHIEQTLRSDEVLRARVVKEMSADEFREMLTRHCAGVWILLRHLLDELRAGLVSPDNLPPLPEGLWTHYSQKLDELTRDEFDLALPALSTLACAAEPLTLDTVVALANIENTAQHRQDLRALVAGRLRQFVRTVGNERNLYYTTMHDSVRDYLTGWRPEKTMTGDEPRLDLLRTTVEETQRRIIDRYVLALFGTRDNFPQVLTADPAGLGRLDGGYGLRNLAAHLEAVCDDEKLHKLLTAQAVLPGDESRIPANVWFVAHEWYGFFAEYRADLARGRRLAARAVDRDLTDGRRANAIGREIRYALMDASVEWIVKSTSANVTPVLLRALVEGRIWAPPEALDRIRAVGDYRSRVRLVAALVQAQCEDDDLPCLSGEGAAYALNLIFPPKSLRECEVAGHLLPRLLEPDRERITHELLRVSLDPDCSLQTRLWLLGMLGGCLDQENLDRAVDTVLAVDGDERNTCAALRGLLPHVSHATLLRVYRLVADRNPLHPGWGLVQRALALRLAAERTHLDWVAKHVTAELVALMHDGIGLAIGLADEPTPDRSPLRTLLNALDESRRTQALNTVLHRIAEEFHGGIAERLGKVGEFLSGSPVASALAIARSINLVNHPGARAKALAALVPVVPERQRPALVAEALQALPSQGSSDDHRREDTLRMLAGHVSGENVAVVQKMVQALEEKDQAEPLAILASRTAGSAGAELRREAVDIAARHSGWRRAEILKKIAPHLDHQTRIRAFDLVPDIGYGRGLQKYRDEALAALAASTRNEEELQYALWVAEEIGDRLPRAAALAALAGQVSTDDRPQLRQRVEELLTGIEPIDQADSLITLASALPMEEHDEVLRRAAALIPTKRDPSDRGYVARLGAVRPVLTEQEIFDWLMAAVDWHLDSGWEGVDLWAALAPPGLTDRRLLKKVWKAARKKLRGAGEVQIAQYIAMIAPHLPESEVSEVTSEAEQRHERVRDLPLAALVHRLDGPHRQRVIRRVLADMCDEERLGEDGPITVKIGVDAHAVAALAQAMTEPERDELLDVVLPRLNRAMSPMDLLARLLPSLSDPQRARALEAGAAMLPKRVTLPGEDFSAVAFHADATFLQKLVETTRYAPDDVKSRAIAAVLSSLSAPPRAVSWNKGAENRVGPVRELLDGLTRPGLLTVLQAAAPHIGHHGGMHAAQECANAIQDVARWWP